MFLLLLLVDVAGDEDTSWRGEVRGVDVLLTRGVLLLLVPLLLLRLLSGLPTVVANSDLSRRVSPLEA